MRGNHTPGSRPPRKIEEPLTEEQERLYLAVLDLPTDELQTLRACIEGQPPPPEHPIRQWLAKNNLDPEQDHALIARLIDKRKPDFDWLNNWFLGWLVGIPIFGLLDLVPDSVIYTALALIFAYALIKQDWRRVLSLYVISRRRTRQARHFSVPWAHALYHGKRWPTKQRRIKKE
jgi:hypothetical protein